MSVIVNAQHQIGFKSDRYSGINAVTTSPTFQLDNPNPYDINLFSTAVSVNTNYAYYSDTSILGLLPNLGDAQYADRDNGISGETQSLVFDYTTDSDDKFAFALVDVLGPSATFRFKKNKFSAGFFTRARVTVTANNVDDGFNFYNFDNTNFGNFFSVEESKASGASWLEFGLNGAKVYRESMTRKINLGANLKYLYGVEAAYAQVNSDASIAYDENEITDERLLGINGAADVEYAYTEGINAENDYEFKQNGSGFALDLGISFTEKRRGGFDNPYDIDYNSKLEINLIDLGYINFKDSYVHRYQRDFNGINDIITFAESTNSLQEFSQDLSFQVYGDSLQSQIDTKFTIGLPTAINIRYDKRYKENFFIQYQIMQRVPVFANAIKRPNLIGITPRYEKNWFGVSLPISFYNYTQFQIGGHVRVGPFHIGTDNAIPFIIPRQELNRANIYVGLKFNPFWDTDYKRHRRRPCYCR